MSEWPTASEVARRLGLSKATLATWRFNGIGPAYAAAEKPGDPVRYDPAEVERLLEERKLQGKAMMSGQIRAVVQAQIEAAAPQILTKAQIVVAVPTVVKKSWGEGTPVREVDRWFWNIRGTSPQIILVSLHHAPENAEDVRIVEVFSLPRLVMRGRKVIARYRVSPGNRVGSMLDPYRVDLSAPDLGPGAPTRVAKIYESDLPVPPVTSDAPPWRPQSRD